MQRIASLFFTLLFAWSLSATPEIVGISILEPENHSGIPHNVVESMHDLAKSELSAIPWVRVVDQSNYDRVMEELFRQEGLNYRNVETLEQGKMQIAHYQIQLKASSGKMQKVYTENENGGKEFSGYKSWVGYAYELIHVGSNTTVDMRTIRVQGDQKDEQNNAWHSTASSTGGWTSRFVFANFPRMSKILKVETNKKGNKIKRITLLGGNDVGIYDKCYFKVCRREVFEVPGGEPIVNEEVIGYLKVVGVEGNISEARALQKTNKNVLAAWQADPAIDLCSDVHWPGPEEFASHEGFFEGIEEIFKFNKKG